MSADLTVDTEYVVSVGGMGSKEDEEDLEKCEHKQGHYSLGKNAEEPIQACESGPPRKGLQTSSE